MKKTHFDDVCDFHDAISKPFATIYISDKPDIERRIRLITEEYIELMQALGATVKVDIFKEANFDLGLPSFGLHKVATAQPLNNVHVLKELCDLAYVVEGTACELGYLYDQGRKRVAASNMTKVGLDGKVQRDENGKILKGENYKEPVLDDLV